MWSKIIEADSAPRVEKKGEMVQNMRNEGTCQWSEENKTPLNPGCTERRCSKMTGRSSNVSSHTNL
ncbi:hypothetical protein EYF80_028004 [Liparis tanakae]|uniref:Uncharacterized protein n=1 Tax=Liparis tanakae TaxID=230148 RepID=A0A4Z2HAG6_9TELE|nr:hypothetical protein EYF80_028004 [Liparis tanakae]